MGFSIYVPGSRFSIKHMDGNLQEARDLQEVHSLPPAPAHSITSLAPHGHFLFSGLLTVSFAASHTTFVPLPVSFASLPHTFCFWAYLATSLHLPIHLLPHQSARSSGQPTCLLTCRSAHSPAALQHLHTRLTWWLQKLLVLPHSPPPPFLPYLLAAASSSVFCWFSIFKMAHTLLYSEICSV